MSGQAALGCPLLLSENRGTPCLCQNTYLTYGACLSVVELVAGSEAVVGHGVGLWLVHCSCWHGTGLDWVD